MTQLAETLASLAVAPRSIAICWLGQAGFVFKTADNQLIYVDAYLSNYCEKMPGNEILTKRLIPAPLEASEIGQGLVISTHAHEDHLDPETISVIAENAPEVEFAGPASCIRQMEKLGVPTERMHLMREGNTCDFDGFSLRAVFADHGQLEPDALGVVLESEGIRVYHTGDTSYCPEKMAEVIDLKPDVIIPCINGTYGNLSAFEAARLANDVGAKVAIPSHYWFFIVQNTRGDCTPNTFLEACAELAPQTTPAILGVGELYMYPGG